MRRLMAENDATDAVRTSQHPTSYIHWNPVKHGWVKRVGDWPHSSFHAYVRSGFYPADWAGNPDETIDGGE
jgi:putative transposase